MPRQTAGRPGRTSRRHQELGVGTGQVRLLWGALAFMALLLVAVAYRISVPGALAATNTAVAQETAMQTAAIPEPSPEALPTVRVVAESDDADNSARRYGV